MVTGECARAVQTPDSSIQAGQAREPRRPWMGEFESPHLHYASSARLLPPEALAGRVLPHAMVRFAALRPLLGTTASVQERMNGLLASLR